MAFYLQSCTCMKSASDCGSEGEDKGPVIKPSMIKQSQEQAVIKLLKL